MGGDTRADNLEETLELEENATTYDIFLSQFRYDAVNLLKELQI